MPTFSDLGIDFPLFGADVGEARRWSSEGTCALCRTDHSGFELGIGDYIAATCGSCTSDTYAPADGRPEPCPQCGGPVHLTTGVEGAHACWRCLRSGAWGSTKDTEAGMVTPVHALLGTTQGLPYPAGAGETDDSDQPTIASWPAGPTDADGWRPAHIPVDVLTELVRTPGYETWQGDFWLFHCGAGMRYLGAWGKADFDHAAENGRGADLAHTTAGLPAEIYADLSDHGGESSVCAYMFRCTACEALRGHWDCD